MRFPEFAGEWNTDVIGNVAPLQRGFDLPTQNVEEGNYPVVYSNGILRKHKDFKCEAPGLVTGRSGSIGNFTFIPEGKYWPHNTSLWVTNFHGNNPLFVYYLYQTINIGQYATGSGVPTLNRNDVHRHEVSIPRVKEQRKIADFLSLIDKRITTQIRIIEELKLYRNTLMFKLLTPKDKWLRLSIGDVAQVIGGGTPDTNIEDYWNGNIQWFTPSEIGKEKYVTESERTLTQKGLDNSSAKFLPPGTILLSTRATIGECSIAKQECCTNQGFQSLIAKKVTPEFLYYLIQTKKKDLLSKASGSTFAEISANEVRKINICIPNTQEEQKAIVQPLSAYDERIETECKILHLYELQKQYLLGQMFI